jgi:hypothetical protein
MRLRDRPAQSEPPAPLRFPEGGIEAQRREAA